MAKRKIRLKDDEILRKKSKVVHDITPSVLTLLDDMAETMYDANGVGIAAPQVGVLKRIVLVDVGDGLNELINPEIVETEGMQKCFEACLSVPGESAVVPRPKYVKLKAINRDGKEIFVEGEGFKAIAFCHEIDHLDGTLYIDKAISDEEADNYDEDEEE